MDIETPVLIFGILVTTIWAGCIAKLIFTSPKYHDDDVDDDGSGDEVEEVETENNKMEVETDNDKMGNKVDEVGFANGEVSVGEVTEVFVDAAEKSAEEAENNNSTEEKVDDEEDDYLVGEPFVGDQVLG